MKAEERRSVISIPGTQNSRIFSLNLRAVLVSHLPVYLDKYIRFKGFRFLNSKKLYTRLNFPVPISELQNIICDEGSEQFLEAEK